ncbi:MAG: hypothetical protein QM758_07080 [Armatimonas sp.]
MKKALWVVGAMIVFEGAMAIVRLPIEGAGVWLRETKDANTQPVAESTNTTQLSPKGTLFLARPDEKTLILWEVATEKQRCQLKRDPARGAIGELYFTPDEKRVLGCCQDGIQVWNTRNGEPEAFWRLPKGEYGWPGSLQFSSDGAKVLVSVIGWSSTKKGSSDDSTSVQLWSSKTGRLLEHYTGSSPIATLSPAADKISVINYRSNEDAFYQIQICDFKSGRKIESPKLTANFSPESLEFLPDGDVLCKGSVSNGEHFGESRAWLWNRHKNALTPQSVTTARTPKLWIDTRLRNREGQTGR